MMGSIEPQQIERTIRGEKISGWRLFLWRLRARIGFFTDRWPSLHLGLLHRKFPDHVVNAESDLLLEGYPRSSNSFTRELFLWSQDYKVKVASHLHCSSNVRRAVELGVPTVLLVRDPEQAVPSLYLKNPSLTMKLALEKYTTFYRRCLPVAKSCVVATFEQVLGDFGEVIARVNGKFGTEFGAFEHNDENIKAVRDYMSEGCRRRRGKVVKEWMNLPSEKREQQKALVAQQLESTQLAKELEMARILYRQFCQLAEQTDSVPVEADEMETE
ncbi:MAG: hypothetical protein ACLFUJ_01365 [Phycisphaerae bacterium]